MTNTAAPVPRPHWPAWVEHELTPYHAMPVSDVQSMLVLAPHPDDEVFGCGGLLALAADAGIQAHVVILSDGGLGGGASTREAESLAAARVLGGASAGARTHFWRLPDRGLVPGAALQQRIHAALELTGAQWLLAPSPFEVHPDHRAVCLAAVEVARQRQQHGAALQLLLCEVGQPLMPNRLLDITAVAERKRLAMQCFGSQLAGQDYAQQISGLNRYRAYTLGPRVAQAEAYWLVSPDELAGGIEGLLDAVLVQLRRRL